MSTMRDNTTHKIYCLINILSGYTPKKKEREQIVLPKKQDAISAQFLFYEINNGITCITTTVS